jgi:hypothetical protein
MVSRETLAMDKKIDELCINTIRTLSMAGATLETLVRVGISMKEVTDVASPPPRALWLLRGVTSNERYVTRGERQMLVAKQPALGRPEAVCAALIPIQKSEAWWDLTQDEKREIFETRSEHIKTGLRYLPEVARRLHHSRDLGEPFDFLT